MTSSTQDKLVQPTRSRKFQALFAVAVFGVLFVAFGLYKYLSISAAIAANSHFSPPPEAITTVVVATEEWPMNRLAVGSVSSPNGVTLSAEEAGTVKRINVESGAQVEANQVLIELDTSVEEAQLAGAKSQQALAQQEIAKIRPLRERNAVSKSDLDRAEAALLTANAEVASLSALIVRKRIIAPFSGYAGIRQVNVGQYVAAGTGIIPLFSLKPVFVDFTLPQEALFDVHQGQQVQVTINEAPLQVFGELTAVNPQVDPSTRNVSLQATVANEQERLRPGMFVRVSVSLGTSQKVMPIPSSSISYAPYGDSVFVLEDMKSPAGEEYVGVRSQIVKLGEQRGDQIAVLEGLKPGDEVATSGVFKLRPGVAVAVNNHFAPSNSTSPTPADI